MGFRGIAAAFCAAIVMVPSVAGATFSAVAFDAESGRFGGASASCVPLEVLRQVYGHEPGVGAVLTQSYLLPDLQARHAALGALSNGATAEEALGALTDPAFDPQYLRRQYAVFDIAGNVATFTGPEALPFASDRVITSAPFTVVVAGNILTGPSVLDDAADAFVAEGCDLEERLMRALLAAGRVGQGDQRCVDDHGVSAQSALLHVARNDGDLTLEIEAALPPPEDPVVTLAGQFDVWRADHPCPVEEPDPTPEPEEPPSSSPPDGGCQTSPSSGPNAWWLLALVAVARRRSRSC